MWLKMSQKQDLAFIGLLISVIVHFLLGYGAAHLPPLNSQSLSGPTEITIVEKDRAKRATLAPEAPADQKKDVFDDLKKEADYLAALTQRVKKQMVAPQGDVNRNSLERFKPQPKSQPPSQPQKVGGRQQSPGDLPTSDSKPTGPQLRQTAIGPASLNNYIPGIQEGYFTALNADQFTYFAFFNRVNEQVRNRWVSLVRAFVGSLSPEDLTKLSTHERQSRIEIILNKNGDFIRARLISSSGYTPLDQAAADGFRMAAPFLNPPQELVEADGFIHLKYSFVLHFRPHFGPGAH